MRTHLYMSEIANFRYRGSNLSDIQRKEIIQNVFVPNRSFHFPKVDGRQFKRVAETVSMVMLLSKHGWWILFSLCII